MKNKIKELRKAQGLRQEDLAAAMGVTRQTIIAIENNKYDPTLELAMRLSKYFGASVNEVFSEKLAIPDAPEHFDCGMEKDRYWFRYRAGAIIVRDNKMLFVKSRYGGYYYMIGGGVHLGEDSRSCVEREAYEETGVRCKARRIAIICENFFYGEGGVIDGKECHELEYYYLMDLPDNASFTEETDASERLAWISLEEFSKSDIRPAFLKEELKRVIEGAPLVHVINDERTW